MELRLLKYLTNKERLAYAIKGLWRRITQTHICPCCSSADRQTIDRKLMYVLDLCDSCGIIYRFPYETASQLNEYYQEDYEEHGLTTDLPSDEELKKLIAENFRGSRKDFSRVIKVFKTLDLPPTARVLDYGANWGYACFQFCNAGYQAQGYEVSRPRAAFGEKLGIHIETKWSDISSNFDVIYSAHVLEHVANPLAAINEQLSHVQNGGYIIAQVPNGSEPRRRNAFSDFHVEWGLPHPIFISAEFIRKNFAGYACYIGTIADIVPMEKWDRRSFYQDNINDPELLVVIRKVPV